MSILICMPCYGGNVSEQTTLNLFNLGKLLVRQGIDHGIVTMANESLITKGRSKLANFFINNTEYDYLFFLDADIGFQPEDVLKLLSHQKEIVSGAYPMKTLPLKWNFSLSQPTKRQKNLIAIDKIGIGFTIIHRSVFEKIKSFYGEELKYTPDFNSNVPPTTKELNNSYHYFCEMKFNDRFLPEDLSFFARAKECGVQAWMDSSINLKHVGSYIFRE